MDILGLENINESLQIHFLIYKITNNVNGKYYIGQHKTEDPYDNYMGSGNLIRSAIRKYGIQNFIKEILFDFDNFEDMNKKEKELVNKNTCLPNNPMSYNLSEGGTGGNKIIWTQEKRKKCSIKFKKFGKDNPFYGKKHSAKTKKSISKHTRGKNNPAYGHIWLYNATINDRVYVKKEEVQKYLDVGYNYGLGLKWFNNGKENIRAIECPKGYVHGRLRLWVK